MSAALYAVAAVSLVSLISLIGLFAISLKESTLDRILFILISFSAGSILGTAFLDLLPEAIHIFGETLLTPALYFITLGFLAFFFLERFIYWFHGHVHGYDPVHHSDHRVFVKKFVYLNLVGDAIHNLIDGMIIAGSFLIGPSIGVATTVAVLFHELPQEIGDFGVLVYGGFSKYRALLFNFLSALSALLGVFLTLNFAQHFDDFVGTLLAIAAGGFIYLASSELIPEMQRETDLKKSIIQFSLFIVGLMFIVILNAAFPE
jgi:zinc and cadmium transporter